MKYIKLALISCVGLFLILLLIALLSKEWYIPTVSYKNASNGILEPTNAIQIVYAISMCESGGRADAWHRNDGSLGSDSRGILQFKKPTFALYWKKLINPDIEKEDIENLWLDPTNQKMLAEMMLTDNIQNLHAWENCSRKLHLLASSANSADKK